MKKIAASLFIVMLCLSTVGYARDDKSLYSISDAMNISAAKEKLNKGYAFIFGDQEHGKIIANHGEFTSNKKTNAFNKTDEFACQWVFLSAMLSFQDRIAQEGGNAVVNIRSYYKQHEIKSTSEFECGNGAFVAGVTFVGDVVTLEK